MKWIAQMSPRNTLVRNLHDLGLAVWFGGSLAGAVAVNGAAADVPDPTLRLRVANTGWARWTPVNAVAIAAHLVGAPGLLRANRGRAATQAGSAHRRWPSWCSTGAALAVTAYSRVLGKQLLHADGVPVEGATDPAPVTPPELAKAQQRLDTCQWLVPLLTGGISVLERPAGRAATPDPAVIGDLGQARALAARRRLSPPRWMPTADGPPRVAARTADRSVSARPPPGCCAAVRIRSRGGDGNPRTRPPFAAGRTAAMNSPQPPLGIGAPVIGGAGELLGHVRTVYVDNATGAPVWAAVQGPHHTAVVPLQHSWFDGRTLQVPYDAAKLQAAPHHDPTALISYPEGDDLSATTACSPTRRPTRGRRRTHLGRPEPEDVAVIRSQEQLRTDAVNVVVGRARLITTVVTENQTFTVPVRRQEVRLVYDPIPEDEQTIASTDPSEDTVEVILHAERVQITTQVVPVERVRMVRRVVTTAQTITEPVRSEQIALDQTNLPGPRPGDNQEETP